MLVKFGEVQCNAVYYSEVQYITVYYSAVYYSAVQSSERRHQVSLNLSSVDTLKEC